MMLALPGASPSHTSLSVDAVAGTLKRTHVAAITVLSAQPFWPFHSQMHLQTFPI